MPEQTPSRSWQYHNPVRVVQDSLTRIADFFPPNAHVLLVTSKGFVRRGMVARIQESLAGARSTLLDEVKPNPDLQDLDAATSNLRRQGISAVIGLGGGSALDTAKTLSLTLSTDVANPLQTIFRQQTNIPWQSRLPLVAIPTTSGTGAEVTPFATVWDHAQHRKHSLASPLMYPDIALLDAELTLTLPEQETLYPGLDTFSHALESLWNRNATPISRMLALKALALAVKALPTLLNTPSSLVNRADMQLASTLAGMAISQTRTAIAHAISYPITTRFGTPHGLACSFTLPALLKINIEHLASNLTEKELLKDVLNLLDNLNLDIHLQKYISPAELLQLEDEMTTLGRNDNYQGCAPIEIAKVLRIATQSAH
ncbi:MAG: alcohol dehydrogenase [Chloroflexi bacterium HGW-Chloroflexi-6]|nr:MAG: alcohol dehydrogenase [Chloroflexi bacterium HGW-Chloroflexi-6]